jgi:hypothetical protein
MKKCIKNLSLYLLLQPYSNSYITVMQFSYNGRFHCSK